MRKNTVAQLLVCGLLVLAGGCERVREPWVRQPEELSQERARPEPAALELRHRLARVQTDR